MNQSELTIRTMSRAEVDLAVDWAADEGWNPGFGDSVCFFTTDPEGFLIGLLGDEPVAAISAVRYGGSFGFLGFFLVRPDQRGKGFGFAMGQAALKRLAGRLMGLDGVVAQQENYKKAGFTLAFRSIRQQGMGGGLFPKGTGIVDLASLPFEAVAGYDRPFFPEPRIRFLENWITPPGGRALGVMEDDRLAGYGVIRKCRVGWKIGPLFADRPELADLLYRALKSHAGDDGPVFLDTPEINREAVALARRHGMSPVFETARMYSGPAPDLPLGRTFGITSFELG